MPELPEVYTITQDLSNNIVGYTIKKVVVAKNYNPLPNTETFISKTINTKIKSVHRVAKNIIIELDSGNFIQIHLAMTGKVLLREPQEKTDQWIKVVFIIQKNADIKQLRFGDVRMFGKIALLSKNEFELLKGKYGPEPLDKNLSPEQFLNILKSKKTNIKNALLNQNLISGVGNIYATEALFMSKINPQILTKEVTPNQAETLLNSLRSILNESIKNRGSTLPDKMYVDLFGKSGSHQNYFKIYMKNVCSECGIKVSFIKLNGRGTYFCLRCQPYENN